ncbi:uncharacterized protein BCR38DRAFT_479446 [Pseudomassariella vexata]|uniref:CBM-cenC domain-containing protein n=1 Tax=Pseudomassariella vexata TaxID=1141098 RepID=A0A1Y2EH64_9PEZI|nr:uncharacterized protein BCR38DRAFT_479446 [Pseudomassariella vexata]ORY70912.1 hypothetical protein BCR38DRAFT_479446 [Pseudomassariella vexata]
MRVNSFLAMASFLSVGLGMPASSPQSCDMLAGVIERIQDADAVSMCENLMAKAREEIPGRPSVNAPQTTVTTTVTTGTTVTAVTTPTTTTTVVTSTSTTITTTFTTVKTITKADNTKTTTTSTITVPGTNPTTVTRLQELKARTTAEAHLMAEDIPLGLKDIPTSDLEDACMCVCTIDGGCPPRRPTVTVTTTVTGSVTVTTGGTATVSTFTSATSTNTQSVTVTTTISSTSTIVTTTTTTTGSGPTVTCGSCESTNNMALNGGFENSPLTGSDWTITASGAPVSDICTDADYAFDGSKYLTYHAVPADGLSQATIRQIMAVCPSRPYMLTFAVGAFNDGMEDINHTTEFLVMYNGKTVRSADQPCSTIAQCPTYKNGMYWRTITINLPSTSSTGNCNPILDFIFRTPSSNLNQDWYYGLDQVSLVGA